jgi:hypothetical protein
MKWITRKDVKVDRVACPWLIKKFVDPSAEFLFVEETDLLDEAKRRLAHPFESPRKVGGPLKPAFGLSGEVSCLC